MGLPANTKTEKRALNALESIIDNSPIMDYTFNSADKEMAWDGYIWIFKNSDIESKKNYDDKIPVQIKGHVDTTEKYVNESEITYSVNKEDLNLYFNDRGVLYFQIFITTDGNRNEIFYASLFPSKIMKYLDEIERKGNKGSIKIPFVKLNKKDIYIITKQFSNESWKQGSGRGQLVPRTIMLKDMDKVTSVTATAVGVKNEYEFLQRLSTGDVCFYGTTKESGVQLPLEWIDGRIFYMHKEVTQTVSIKDTVYYERYELNMGSDKEISIILSENTHIQLSKGKFHFKPRTGIRQLRRDAEFLLNVVQEREYAIDSTRFPFGNLDMPKDLEEELKFYIELDDILNVMEFDYNEPFEKIEWKTRHQLGELVAWKNGLRNQYLNEDTHILNWKLEGRYIPLIIRRHYYDEKNDILSALYTNKHQALVKNEKNQCFKVPLFAHVKKHVLGNLYYYNYSYFYNQIDEADYNVYTIDILNQAALNLISAFDINGDEELLNIAMYQLEKICEVEYRDYIIINKIQIRKRLGELEIDDIETLRNIKSDDLQIQYGINILLDNKDKAQQCYEHLDIETQDFLKEYPIFMLYKKLMDK